MPRGLLDHFTRGTTATVTGASLGIEVETHFRTATGRPIPVEITRRLLAITPPGPWRLTIDLGRQLLEIAVDPQPRAAALHTVALEALDWLYREAARLGAYPVFEPVFDWPGQLLWIQEERDRLWINLDGPEALEHLCRIASVQFTISVAPGEAVTALNRLHAAGLHHVDYPNDAFWRRYIQESRAAYRPDRYAGPTGFDNLEDYVARLTQHEPVMPGSLELFLRSIWWHYRLRRYSDTLTIETRPFARRSDAGIAANWRQVETVLGL